MGNGRKFQIVSIVGKISPMPWPATHILIAEKVFKRYFSHLEEGSFFLGTCFPDIRYLAKISRELTHFNHFSLAEIQSQTPFYAGLHFHSLTDAAWNAYVRLHNDRLFSVIPHNHAMLHTLKILQDKYLYHKFEGWGQVAAQFNSIPPEAHDFGIPPDVLEQWQAMLARYLEKPPQREDVNMLQLTLLPKLVEKIRRYYQVYQSDPVVQAVMTGFYDAAVDFLNADSPQYQPPT